MLTCEYALEPEDVRRGVRLLFAPTPATRKLRRRLLAVVAVLWLAAGGLIAYLLAVLWGRRCPARTLVYAVTGVWAVLGALAGALSRNPDWLLHRVCDWTARRMLARARPGPRRLTLTAEGVEVEAGGVKHARPWSAFRRARRDDKLLVLAARDLWFFVPLDRIPAAARAELAREAEARVAFLTIV